MPAEGFTSLALEPPENLVSGIIDIVTASIFWGNLVNFLINKILTPALVIGGILYLAKCIWEMTRGHENWDEVLVFLIKKSLPVLLVVLFVTPSSIFSEGGNYPLGIQLYLAGAKAAFKTVETVYGYPFEKIPLAFFSQHTTYLHKVEDSLANMEKRKTETEKKSDGLYQHKLFDPRRDETVVYDESIVGDSGEVKAPSKWDFFYSLFTNPVGTIVKGLALFFKKLVEILFSFFIDAGYVIVFLTLIIVYYLMGFLVAVKFVALAPLFLLSVLFVLVDRWKDLFFTNLRHYFALLIQPLFIVLGFGIAMHVTFLTMDWIVYGILNELDSAVFYSLGVIATVFFVFYLTKVFYRLPTQLCNEIINFVGRSTTSYYAKSGE